MSWSDTVHTGGCEAGAHIQLCWLSCKIGRPEQRGRTCSRLHLEQLQLNLRGGGGVFFKQSVWLIDHKTQNTRKIKRTVSRVTISRICRVLTCKSPCICISFLCLARYTSCDTRLFHGVSLLPFSVLQAPISFKIRYATHFYLHLSSVLSNIYDPECLNCLLSQLHQPICFCLLLLSLSCVNSLMHLLKNIFSCARDLPLPLSRLSFKHAHRKIQILINCIKYCERKQELCLNRLLCGISGRLVLWEL